MTKKTLLAMFVLAVMLIGIVPASNADNLSFYVSTTSATTGYTQLLGLTCNGQGAAPSANSCSIATVTSGVLNFANLNGSSNVPGTASLSKTVGSTTDITTTAAVHFWLLEVVGNFTAPTGTPLSLVAHETLVSGTTGHMITTGYYGGSVAGGVFTVGSCSTVTADIVGAGAQASNAPAASCANAPPFTLSSLTEFNLASGADINIQTEVDATYSVPEPASMLLFGSGLAGLAGILRRKLSR